MGTIREFPGMEEVEGICPDPASRWVPPAQEQPCWGCSAQGKAAPSWGERYEKGYGGERSRGSKMKASTRHTWKGEENPQKSVDKSGGFWDLG